jgi:hypothetical protein
MQGAGMPKFEKSKFIWVIIVALTPCCPVKCLAEQAASDIDRVFPKFERHELLTCWTETAVLYASKTCDSAEVVVNAAFGKCLPQENKVRSNIVAKVPAMGKPSLSDGKSGVESFMEGVRSGARPIILSAIFDKRVEQGHCADKDSR